MEWTEVIVANLVTFALAMLGVIVAIVIYKKDKRHMRDTKTINKLATKSRHTMSWNNYIWMKWLKQVILLLKPFS